MTFIGRFSVLIPSLLLIASPAFAQTVGDDTVPATDASASLAASKSGEAVVTQPPEPAPPAPLSCSWNNRACTYPHLVAAIDLGVGHFNEGNPFGFDTGVGAITSTGPVAGVRFGAELTTWFAIEAHYSVMSNATDADRNAGVTRHFFTNALVAELRFTAPVPYVQPYAFVGAGLYSTSLTGSSASTELTGSTELGIPVGIGFSVPMSRGLSIGAEGTYHRLFSESFSENEDIGGGEPSTATAVLRARF